MNNINTYYPPVGFYFSVGFQGINNDDASFQEVSGISAQIETESIVEGGENRFAHKVPGRTKYQNLVLKRGLMKTNAAFAKWISSTLNDGLSNPIQPKIIIVKLLNQDGKPAMSWIFHDAYPIKWNISGNDQKKNSIAVESIELAYTYFEQTQTGNDLKFDS